MRFWLELNPAVDEYASGGTAVGLFTANGWCIVGVEMCNRRRVYGFWRYGLIVFNIGVGVWSG